MISATGKIMCPSVDDWTTSPLSRVWIVRSSSAPTSLGVTSVGPNAPVDGKFLPGVNCCVCHCQSRTLPSLKQEYPATRSRACSAETRKPPRPMTTASSPSKSSEVENGGGPGGASSPGIASGKPPQNDG